MASLESMNASPITPDLSASVCSLLGQKITVCQVSSLELMPLSSNEQIPHHVQLNKITNDV